VERSHLVHGFAIGKNKYVTLTKDDLDKVALPSSKAIEVERFVGPDEIDPIYYDHPYYLVPDGKMAEEAYVVIRQAMQREDKAALGRLVLSNREHAVAIRAWDPGMVLFYAAAVTGDTGAQESFRRRGAHQGRRGDGRHRDPHHRSECRAVRAGAFVDRYHDAVRKLIEARRKGVKPVSAPGARAEQRRRSDGSLEEEPSLRRWRQAARP